MIKHSPVIRRRSTTLDWLPSDDSNSYKVLLPDGSPNYSKNEFNYKFNSSGFRCDEFDSPADLRILFLGCSFTEGIGLPLSDIWPTFLLDKIRSLPHQQHKRIPHWSLALGGSGIDTAASMVHEHIKVINPAYIFCFFTNMYRREFRISRCPDSIQYWIPNFTPVDENKQEGYKIVSELFSDKEYMLYQSSRSLMILNQAAKLSNSKLFMFTRDKTDIEPDSFDCTTFNTLNTGTPSILPTEYKYLLNKPKAARDSLHHGALWQYNLYEQIWDKVKSEFLTPN